VARPRPSPNSRSTGDYRHDAARRKNNPPDDLFDHFGRKAMKSTARDIGCPDRSLGATRHEAEFRPLAAAV
jgi:hypothetical protein